MSVLVVAIYAPLRQLTFKTLQNFVNIDKKAEKCLGSGHYSNLTYSESEVFEHIFETLLPSGSDS